MYAIRSYYEPQKAPLFDAVADGDVDAAEMVVAAVEAFAVIDDDRVPGIVAILRDHDHPRVDGGDLRSHRGFEIGPRVKALQRVVETPRRSERAGDSYNFV